MGKIAKAKICSGYTIHIPKAVAEIMNAKKGDIIEFYPATMYFDEREFKLNDMVVMVIKEK